MNDLLTAAKARRAASLKREMLEKIDQLQIEVQEEKTSSPIRNAASHAKRNSLTSTRRKQSTDIKDDLKRGP